MRSKLFKFHKLNAQGIEKAKTIQSLFELQLTALERVITLDGREMSIVRTKLEEACFFAKKAMAVDPTNNEGEE